MAAAAGPKPRRWRDLFGLTRNDTALELRQGDKTLAAEAAEALGFVRMWYEGTAPFGSKSRMALRADVGNRPRTGADFSSSRCQNGAGWRSSWMAMSRSSGCFSISTNGWPLPSTWS